MKKQNVLLLIILGLTLTTASCTSKKVDKEGADVAELAGEDVSAEGSDLTEGSTDDFGAEESSTESSGEAAATTEGADDLDELGADDIAGDDETTSDSATTESTETAETTPEAPAEEAPTSTDEMGSSLADSGSSDETQGFSGEPEAPKPVVPLQKMITTPYTSGDVLVNAIYVAREGDTLDSVSQKIYGSDKTKELKKINPTFARREMKVGDKVYYNSPQRPNDSTTVLTFYEDQGMSPEVYMSQAGDNIRTVSKNLLGNENSWKEVWSTNLDVESKAELPEGTKLRYWSSPASTSPAAPPVAEAPVEAPPTTTPEPPPAEMAQNDVPPPMPDEAVPPPSEASISEPPPPPPPPPSEPPPPVAMGDDAQNALGDEDQMMTIGIGAIIIFALIALFIIRKKRSRRSGIDFQTATNTQID